MHVVYLIDSLIVGGAERSLAVLAPEYRKRGVQLEVAYLYERDNVWIPAIEAAGVEVVSLAGAGAGGRGRGRAGLVRRVAGFVRARRPDICHTTLFDADVIGRVASIGSGAKVVCSLVNAAYGPEQLANPAVTPWRLRTVQLVDIATARRVRRFHAVSESVAASMASRLKVPRARIDVIPRGRDPEEIGTRTPARRSAARRSLGVGDDTPLLLAVGRHEYQKGFDVLLESFALVHKDRPGARLVVAGREGADSAQLRDRAGRLDLGESVSFLGFRTDIPELLCAADVFVSTSRWEGSPGGVIEAMALETPIVTSDIAPVREVLGDAASVWLVAPPEPEGFATAIGAALDGDVSVRTAAARARFLDRYTIDRVADEMVRFYDRALGARGSSVHG